MNLAINQDNTGLQPSETGAIYIGCVDIVNGEAACEFPDFIPTRAELLELIKYWERIFLDRTFFMFKTRQIGSTYLRICPFAERRVKRVIELLGRDATEAVAEVSNQFCHEILPRALLVPVSIARGRSE